MSKLYFVFDVESVGLHGEGFAVGFVVVNEFGVEIQHGLIACEPSAARGNAENRKWIKENVPDLHELNTTTWCESNCQRVRDSFWEQFMCWKKQGAVIAADCNWPVEANFLSACVNDQPADREWGGPYPLIDVGSVLLACGKDPLAKYPRLPDEMDEHNPLCDARQSARILVECLHPSVG